MTTDNECYNLRLLSTFLMTVVPKFISANDIKTAHQLANDDKNALHFRQSK